MKCRQFLSKFSDKNCLHNKVGIMMDIERKSVNAIRVLAADTVHI